MTEKIRVTVDKDGWHRVDVGDGNPDNGGSWACFKSAMDAGDAERLAKRAYSLGHADGIVEERRRSWLAADNLPEMPESMTFLGTEYRRVEPEPKPAPPAEWQPPTKAETVGHYDAWIHSVTLTPFGRWWCDRYGTNDARDQAMRETTNDALALQLALERSR